MEVNALPPFSTFIPISFFLLYFMLKAIFVEITLKQRMYAGGAERRRIESISHQKYYVIFVRICIENIFILHNNNNNYAIFSKTFFLNSWHCVKVLCNNIRHVYLNKNKSFNNID